MCHPGLVIDLGCAALSSCPVHHLVCIYNGTCHAPAVQLVSETFPVENWDLLGHKQSCVEDLGYKSGSSAAEPAESRLYVLVVSGWLLLLLPRVGVESVQSKLRAHHVGCWSPALSATVTCLQGKHGPHHPGEWLHTCGAPGHPAVR